MPQLPPRVCAHPGCPKTTYETYCAAHKRYSWGDDRIRGDRHQRGYGTQWDKLRAKILRRDDYLCQPCKREGRITAAKQVDHILSKARGGTDSESNLQSICIPCHKAKTARE